MLEKALNYIFVDKELLAEALTHRSFYHESQDKSLRYNERVEFLGDAVLGLTIGEKLFREKSTLDESEMSRMKSYLVSRHTLAQIACSLNLGVYLMLGKGEDSTGGREKLSLLANSLEAIFGAVFLDGGYEVAREVILHLYEPILKKVMEDDFSYDFKTELQEVSQKLYGTLPEYRLICETGNDHEKKFTYEVTIGDKYSGIGTGKNKKTAQTCAARMALDRMKSDRELEGC